MRFLSAGSRAVLLELGALEEVVAVHDRLRRRPPDGVTQLVPAARTILVGFDPEVTTPDRLAAQVASVTSSASGATTEAHTGTQHALVEDVPRPEVRIPVVYDGPDLAAVAELTGLGVAEVVERHAATAYTVAFCGFAPGFAYLSGLDPLLCLPRREVPRTQVPAGSVAISDRFTAVYPHVSPGGWHLLGSTTAVMWDVDRRPPGLLAPGDRVRFVPVRP